MGAAAAVVLLKERHIVEAFERAGAVSTAQAVVPEDIGVDQYGVGWRRLRARAVVRETTSGSDRFYLDVEVWQALRRLRHRVLGAVIVLVALVFLVMTTTTWLR